MLSERHINTETIQQLEYYKNACIDYAEIKDHQMLHVNRAMANGAYALWRCIFNGRKNTSRHIIDNLIDEISEIKIYD